MFTFHIAHTNRYEFLNMNVNTPSQTTFQNWRRIWGHNAWKDQHFVDLTQISGKFGTTSSRIKKYKLFFQGTSHCKGHSQVYTQKHLPSSGKGPSTSSVSTNTLTLGMDLGAIFVRQRQHCSVLTKQLKLAYSFQNIKADSRYENI